MSKPFAARLLQPLSSSLCNTCRNTPIRRPLSLRPFSSIPASSAAKKEFIDLTETLAKNAASSLGASSLGNLSNVLSTFKNPDMANIIPESQQDDLQFLEDQLRADKPMYHFHVYATKHNTHITLTRPNRDPIISVSCGNIGFRKAARGTYDSAYQLAAYTMSLIQDKGLLTEIRDLEVVFRGFGPGREAVAKVIMSSEGRNIRNKIQRLTDATRLKFGGTRSPRPRRLG